MEIPIVGGNNPNVPIIGQPKIGDYVLLYNLKCPCGHQFMVTAVVGVPKPCLKCTRVFILSTWPVANAQGLMFEHAVGIRTQEKIND